MAARSRRCLLGRRRPADGRHGHGNRDQARLVRVLRRPVGVDDGGDAAPRRGADGGLQRRARRRPRGPALRGGVPCGMDADRRGRLRGLSAARHRCGRRTRNRGRDLRAHAPQAPLPPALSQPRALGFRARLLVRGLEHRPDGAPARRGRDERALDVDRRSARRRPEAPAAAGCGRRAARAGDRRPRRADRRLAVGGARTDPSDVKEEPMTNHVKGTRDEWLAARRELLEAEKELTRRSDELARRRRELPWVRVEKDYRFDTDEGEASLADLFRGRSQLLVYHFMFGPDYTAGCPACSAIADGFDGSAVHLANHDVTLMAISRAPLAKLQAYERRMRWTFPWAS